MVESEEPKHPTWLRDFVLLSISRFCMFFSHRQVQPVFPVYLSSLGASGTLIGFVMSSFTIMATVSRPFIGMLMDRSGRKVFLLLGLGIFGLTTLGYAWAPTIMTLVVFRTTQGLGWSCGTTAVATLAADIAPSNKRGTIISYAGLASNLGAALGPIAGFAAYQHLGFHGMFLTVFGVVLVGLLFSLPIKESQRLKATEGPLMTWWELFVVRESLLPAVAMAFIAFGHSGTATFIPLYILQQDFGNPAYFFVVESVSVMISRPIVGPLSDRINRRAIILPGFVLQILGLILIAKAPSAAVLFSAGAVTGLGLALAHPPLMALAIDLVPAQRRGLSMAQFQTFHDLGNALGAVALGNFLDLVGKNFSAMYGVAAGVVTSGLLLFGIFSRSRRGGRPDLES